MVLIANADWKGAFQMVKIEMTKREQDVYKFILEYRKEKRFSPSMREIADGIALHSARRVFKAKRSVWCFEVVS